jgi:hypothetical protein
LGGSVAEHFSINNDLAKKFNIDGFDFNSENIFQKVLNDKYRH